MNCIVSVNNKKRTVEEHNNKNYCENNINPLKKSKLNTSDDEDLILLSKLLFHPGSHGNVDNNATRRKMKKTEIMCTNPLCNHKTLEEDPTPVNIPQITKITSLTDLIELGKSYHCKKHTTFAGMNLRIMCNLVTPLTDLSRMIGMDSVKTNIINQIMFFLQGNHTSEKCNKCNDCSYNLPCLNSQTEMLHTVITGPPGVGKTEFGKILGKIYKEMGILSKGTFKLVTRADLIAGYLGQTAIKTQKAIDEARGGILFIDEAYSLGNSELRDSFSKECIDTLNQNLTERRDFLCIIAGYENELENCFFKYNAGLRRRFTFRYNMIPYTSEELLKIFELKVQLMNWKLSYLINESDTQDVINQKLIIRNNVEALFRSNIKCFPNYGGDIESLVLNCKIIHTKRCSFSEDQKRTMTFEDISEGLMSFTNHRRYDKVAPQKQSKVANMDFNTNLSIY